MWTLRATSSRGGDLPLYRGVMRNAQSRLGVRFFIDTHLLDSEDPAAAGLWHFHDVGSIELARTDVMDTEIGGAQDPAKRAALMGRSASLPRRVDRSAGVRP